MRPIKRTQPEPEIYGTLDQTAFSSLVQGIKAGYVSRRSGRT
ncbi:hypothetical protein [Litorimonas haliclonae]